MDSRGTGAIFSIIGFCGAGLATLLGMYYVLRPAFFVFGKQQPLTGQPIDGVAVSALTRLPDKVPSNSVWAIWGMTGLGLGVLVLMFVFADALLAFFSVRF